MVRPTPKDSFLRSFVAGSNQRTVAGTRVKRLVLELKSLIKAVEPALSNSLNGGKAIDVGCGNMAISEALEAACSSIRFTRVDTYDAPVVSVTDISGHASGNYSRYIKYDGKTLPFSDKEFDLAICVDVLHHAGVGNAASLLREIARVSRYSIVKDHFEYGFLSRQILRAADFFGNWGYGVNVPKKYFDTESWAQILSDASLQEIDRKTGIRVHGPAVSLLFRPKLHFISVIANGVPENFPRVFSSHAPPRIS